MRRVFAWIGFATFAVWGCGAVYGITTWAWENRPPGLCVRTLQEYVSTASPERDPVVKKCTGEDYDALCFVESLEGGARRTYPFRWSCIGRQPLPER